MPNKYTKYGTKVVFRYRDTKEVKESTFKGEHHAEKAAQFVVANKKELDFHTLQTVSDIS